MLKVKVFDIDFGKEELVLNVKDAREWGLMPQDRVKVKSKTGSTSAIINTTTSFVKPGELGVFSKTVKDLSIKKGDKVSIEPLVKPESVSFIKNKLRGQELSKVEIETIVRDMVDNNLSLIDLTAFVCALDVRGATMSEVEHLTRAMTETGDVLDLPGDIYDKHSLGGVPGDKTTLLVVPIVAAAGLTIPKTSSRAITDPAGTADRMEVFAPVEHNLASIKKIVKKTGGCIVWGGAVDMAPADDVMIQIEYPLSIDPRPLLLASIMSKKLAAGAKTLVIDIPMGPQTKVTDYPRARKLANEFIELGERLGIKISVAITYGAQPVGNNMGPALEAYEALRALEGKVESSLVEKSIEIAGIILEEAGIASRGKGKEKALEILKSGKALEKFRQIIKAQGGSPDIKPSDIKKMFGKHIAVIKSTRRGYVTQINNRDLVNIAKGAGAPGNKGAGVVLHNKGGDMVEKGTPLFTIYAEKKYKLEFAEGLAKKTMPVKVEGMLLEEIPSTLISKH